VALALALGKFDRAQLREQGGIAAEGAIAFYNFVTRAWERYCEEREIAIPLPTPDDR
jgi:hypothetical protein